MALCIIDLIAIPDFSAGAMENWGLITYRLTSLLYDEGKSSDSNKQWVAVVVAHELAHQVCLFYKQKKKGTNFKLSLSFVYFKFSLDKSLQFRCMSNFLLLSCH